MDPRIEPDLALVSQRQVEVTLEVLPKPWYASRGILGPIIAVISLIAGWFGLQVDPASQVYIVDQLVAAISATGILVGAVLGIIGRLRATRVIR